ncbi:hypothetical protein WH87_18240 [Devosia epidermidihirudinis]|uniref:DUF1761 domain-containing protein n=1 Tax=Devosia epidermidihirudinis TaxID=1293439 RepID=A0A0F5Q3A3_9HYPH|nr:DUF1761 domain-containing protein [Devosia epidermidihirudinis]KKC35086.1 hypothetical protein WH87_18240 [Devosia epidermidihirudinis]
MISHFAVNWLAVVLATVASFAFGAVWYMSLSRQWLAALGKTREQLNVGYTPFIWSVVVELVMAYFLALLTPALLGEMSVINGLIVAAHMWFGFVLTSLIMNHRYEGLKWSLTLIDGLHLLGVLLIQGIVLGLLG